MYYDWAVLFQIIARNVMNTRTQISCYKSLFFRLWVKQRIFFSVNIVWYSKLWPKLSCCSYYKGQNLDGDGILSTYFYSVLNSFSGVKKTAKKPNINGNIYRKYTFTVVILVRYLIVTGKVVLLEILKFSSNIYDVFLHT